MRYNVKSAAVLSEADRFQSILDVQLFNMEQDARIWAPKVEGEWYPGDPLYQDPRVNYRNWFLPPGEVEGNCARRMIEEFDDGDRYQKMKCEDCEVSWGWAENVCWNCGKEYVKPRTLNDVFREPIGVLSATLISADGIRVSLGFDAAPFRVMAERAEDSARTLAENFRRAATVVPRRLPGPLAQIAMDDQGRVYMLANRHLVSPNQSLRGLESHYGVYDEWERDLLWYAEEDVRQTLQLLYPIRSMRYEPTARTPTPFEVVERELPDLMPRAVPVLPEVPHRWDNQQSYHLPANWAELRRPVPLPQVRAPRDFSSREVQFDYQIPITERRPRR